MSQIRFLFDEDVSGHVAKFLRRVEPTMDILVVNEPGAPPEGTDDPDVYRAAVAMGRTLVSGDKSTMSATVNADLAAGGHNRGAIFLKKGHSATRCGADLRLIWYCETAQDWIDRIDYIPY
jgi:hypothetical protein